MYYITASRSRVFLLLFRISAKYEGGGALEFCTKTKLDDRKVYYVEHGLTMEGPSLFRFKATREEIFDIVQNAGMRKKKHNGGHVYFPIFSRKPYWFRPKYTLEGLYFITSDQYISVYNQHLLSDDKYIPVYNHKYAPSGNKYLYYEPDTQWAYFVYTES